ELIELTKFKDGKNFTRFVSLNTIKQAEAGGPSYLSTIRRLAEAVGLEPDELTVTSGELPNPPAIQQEHRADQPSPNQQPAQEQGTDPKSDEAMIGRYEPAQITLSRQAPVFSATVPLFDCRKMEDLYYAPMEQGLVGEFGWPSERAGFVRIALR